MPKTCSYQAADASTSRTVTEMWWIPVIAAVSLVVTRRTVADVDDVVTTSRPRSSPEAMGGSLRAGQGTTSQVCTLNEAEAEAARWRKGMFGAPAHANEWTSRHWSSRVLHRVGEIVAHAGSGIVAAASSSAGWRSD